MNRGGYTSPPTGEYAFLSPLSRRIFYLFFSIEFLPRDYRIFRAFRLPIGQPDRILNHHLGSLSRAEEDAFLSPLSRRFFPFFISIDFLLRDFRIFRAFRLPIRQTNAKRGLASPFCVGLPDRILNHHLGSLSRAEEDAFLSPLSRRFFSLFISIYFLLRDCRIFRAFRLPIGQVNAKRGLASPFCVGLPDRIRTCDLKSRSLARYPAEPRADDLHPLLYTDFPAVSIQNRVYFLRPSKHPNII